MTNYSEKLRDPRWQKKRLKILNRDDWACQCCFNEKETLHVHHMTYIKKQEPWDSDSINLITICETCHTKIHSNDESVSSVIFIKLFFLIWLKQELKNG